MGLNFLTAGESHGPALTAILEGMPAGLEIAAEVINRELQRRQQGLGAGPRMKLESDAVRILGGVMEGQTTGAPIALLIENRDHVKWRGRAIAPFTIPRPGHADLSGAVKYGYRDLRPALERASARETAARVAVGAICKLFLAELGIQVGGYVCAIGEVSADLSGIPLEERPARAEQSAVRCPDPDGLRGDGKAHPAGDAGARYAGRGDRSGRPGTASRVGFVCAVGPPAGSTPGRGAAERAGDQGRGDRPGVRERPPAGHAGAGRHPPGGRGAGPARGRATAGWKAASPPGSRCCCGRR